MSTCDPDNHATCVSFPYPQQGSETRPPGQGCIACVHKTYCPAIYWWRVNGHGGTGIDQNVGIRCGSWSNNPLDIVKQVMIDDLEENEYLWNTDVIGSENDDNLQRFGETSS